MLGKLNLDFRKEDIHYYIILLSAPVLLSIYRYHGYPGTFSTIFNTGLPEDQNIRINQFIIFFFLTFVIPALYIIFAMKKPLSEFGLRLGDYKWGIKSLLLIPFLIIPVLYFGAKVPELQSEYPLAKSLLSDHSHLFIYELSYLIFYYIAWEFFFRGFILFGLKNRFGIINAILIQTISSCLVHIDKPEGEIFGSILAGIVLGIIAIRTKSIWYVIILHATIGILTDLFIIYGQN
ncbi:MAG TPA: CPBP family intramembrane metalloprotease [Bacteroidetes bacterium]|nr:CPBP family intramembrane metalloprotease [Bacteroidota bacterium]